MLVGKLFLSLKVKKCFAFFDGNIDTKRDRIVFDETQGV